MGRTVSEKILGLHSGKNVVAGDFVLARVDAAMGNDGSLPLVFEASRKIKNFKVVNPRATVLVLDHYCPSPSREVSMLQEEIRDFAELHRCTLYDWGEGVCHRLLPEKGYVHPGMLVVGADSHTATYGALNSFSTGVGSTDLAIAMHYGMLWFKVPATIRLTIRGSITWPVSAKDAALSVIGDLGASAANYRALEIEGQTISQMDMEGRFTFCNMMVEMGAKAAIMPFDDKTGEWLRGSGVTKSYQPIQGDPDATYESDVSFDLTGLEPQVAFPHQVDNVHPISASLGTPIRMAFLGTCANGGVQDLLDAARILKGKRVDPRVRLVVSPASREVVQRSIENGSYGTLIESGAVMNTPGCGPCVGAHAGVPSDGSAVLSTANRNFLGRMGNREAQIYLSSPATLAASALTAEITDPRTI